MCTCLTSLSTRLPGCSLDRKTLGECVCQKVTQSAHHAGTAQTSSVLWGVSVCVFVCGGVWMELDKGGVGVWGGLFREGQLRGKISLRDRPKFSVSQISAPSWMLYSETWNGNRSVFGAPLSSWNIVHYERWVPLIIDHVIRFFLQSEMNNKSNYCYLWDIMNIFIDIIHLFDCIFIGSCAEWKLMFKRISGIFNSFERSLHRN